MNMDTRDYWLKFGCFLTGYKYSILKNCSEVAARIVKRYTAALLIVCILWAFVGYSFTNRYIDQGLLASVIGSVAAVVIIVQIERQIILGAINNAGLRRSRYALALLMAIIGSMIIDQILFKDDIELQKIKHLSSKVNELLPERTKELRASLANLDSTLAAKETERVKLINEISLNPNIKQYKRVIIDNSTDSVQSKTTNTDITDIPNPKIDILNQLNYQIQSISAERAQKDNDLLKARPDLEKEISDHQGFLDELTLMTNLFKESPISFMVYLIWFFFLMLLEILVLLSKRADSRSDYDDVIEQHMALHQKHLSLHSKKVTQA